MGRMSELDAEMRQYAEPTRDEVCVDSLQESNTLSYAYWEWHSLYDETLIPVGIMSSHVKVK